MNIFTLTGTILCNTSDAENSIAKTGEKAEGLGGKLASGIKTAAKWAAGVTAAATAVGTAMVAAAKDTANELDVIDKASIRMGIAAESYQELAYAAGLSGVEMTTLEKAAKSLVDTDMTFDEALDQLMAIGDESERTAAAVEMFGEKVAYDMQPLLQAGAEGLADMKNEANELGLVMSQETVTNGAVMNDMFSKVEESISTLKNSLMADLMHYIMEILQWLIDNIPKIKETVKTVADAIIPIVKPIMEGVMELLKSVMALINGDLEGFCEGIFKVLEKLGEGLFEAGKTAFTFLWDGLKNIWEQISGWVSEKISWLTDKLTFWKNTNDSMSATGVDGSHASGLNYVPYDGYVAELHRGESVNTAGTTQALMDAIESLKNNIGGSGPIELSINLDSNQIAHAIYNPLQNEGRRRGVSLVNG